MADARAPRDGSYLEWIGTYDPMQDPPAITIKQDRAQYWLSQGAQASDPVRRILEKSGSSEAGSVAVAVEADAPPADEPTEESVA